MYLLLGGRHSKLCAEGAAGAENVVTKWGLGTGQKLFSLGIADAGQGLTVVCTFRDVEFPRLSFTARGKGPLEWVGESGNTLVFL